MEPVAEENNNEPHSGSDEAETTVFLSRNGIIPPELLRTHFASLQAGLNFGLRHSEVEPRLQVIFEGERFQFYCFWENGTSSWKCVFHRLQCCQAMVGIDAGFTVARMVGRHRHSEVTERLLACPQGWRRIEMDGRGKRFWLSHGEQTNRFTRVLMVDGHKYYLNQIYKNESSRWKCSKVASCKARLIVQGVFEQVKQVDQHDHGSNAGECNVELNFAGIRHGGSQDLVFKRLIDSDGQSFKLQSIEPDGSRIFCCVWRDIRNCPVTIRMSSDLKRAEPENVQLVHNHADDIIGVYLQADGRSKIFDKQEHAILTFWLFTIESEIGLKARGMIYQGYKYLLTSISDRGDSTWKCSACEATLQITGLFLESSQQENHTHSPLTIEDINAITASPEESNLLLPTPTNSIPLSKSTLLTALSAFNPNRTFQFHHQDSNNLKILQDGFEYLYLCSKPTYSLWHCIYHSIRCCHATLHLSNDTLQATLNSGTSHSHSDQLWDLYYTPLGENYILDEPANTPKPFHFLIKPTFARPLPHVIYEEHLFELYRITKCGNGSIWRCTGNRDCRVALNVSGRFGKVCVEGLPHVEQPMGEDEQVEWVVRYGSEDKF